MKSHLNRGAATLLTGMAALGALCAAAPVAAQQAAASTATLEKGQSGEVSLQRDEPLRRAGPEAGRARPSSPWAAQPAHPVSPAPAYPAEPGQPYDPHSYTRPAHPHGGHAGRGQPYPDVALQRISCSSIHQRYTRCRTGPAGRVWLAEQHSGSPCMEGRDWGSTGDGIWVNNGCRATFNVER